MVGIDRFTFDVVRFEIKNNSIAFDKLGDEGSFCFARERFFVKNNKIIGPYSKDQTIGKQCR